MEIINLWNKVSRGRWLLNWWTKIAAPYSENICPACTSGLLIDFWKEKGGKYLSAHHYVVKCPKCNAFIDIIPEGENEAKGIGFEQSSANAISKKQFGEAVRSGVPVAYCVINDDASVGAGLYQQAMALDIPYGYWLEPSGQAHVVDEFGHHRYVLLELGIESRGIEEYSTPANTFRRMIRHASVNSAVSRINDLFSDDQTDSLQGIYDMGDYLFVNLGDWCEISSEDIKDAGSPVKVIVEHECGKPDGKKNLAH